MGHGDMMPINLVQTSYMALCQEVHSPPRAAEQEPLSFGTPTFTRVFKRVDSLEE